MIPRTDKIFVGIQFLLFTLFLIPDSLAELPNVFSSYLHWTLMFIGAAFIGIAVLQLNTSLSPFPTPRVSGKLTTNGVFALSRHPIYTGIIIFGLGWALHDQSLIKLLATVALLFLFWFKAGYEENLLLDKYPEYIAYQKKVGRFFWIV